MELAYAKASNGHIPLFSAVKYGHVDVVRFFVVNLGIDVNTKDIMGQTVLHFVATQPPTRGHWAVGMPKWQPS